MEQILAGAFEGYAIGIFGTLTGFGTSPIVGLRQTNTRGNKKGLKKLWKITEEGNKLLNKLPENAVIMTVDMKYLDRSCLNKDPSSLKFKLMKWLDFPAGQTGIRVVENGNHRVGLIEEFLVPQELKKIDKLSTDLVAANQRGDMESVEGYKAKIKQVEKIAQGKSQWLAKIYNKGMMFGVLSY